MEFIENIIKFLNNLFSKIFIVFLTIFVLLLWFWMNEIELSKILNTLKTLNIFIATGACIFLLLTYLFYSLVLKILIKPFRKVRLIKVFQIYLAGAFINQFVPMQQVGLAVDLYLLKRLCNVPIAKSLSAFGILILIEWLVNFLFLLLIPFSKFNADPLIKDLLAFAATFFILLILILFLLLRLKEEGIKLLTKLLFFLPIKYKEKFINFFLSIMEGWEVIIKQKFNLVLVTLILLFLPVIQLISGGFAFFSFEFIKEKETVEQILSIGIPHIILAVIIGQAILFLLLKLPALPAQIGSLEWYITLVFVYGFSFPKDIIAVLTIFIHALFFITTALVGAICVFTLGINLSKLKYELIKEKAKLKI